MDDIQSISVSFPSTGIPFASNFEYKPTRNWKGRTGEFSSTRTDDPAVTGEIDTSFGLVTVFCCQVPLASQRNWEGDNRVEPMVATGTSAGGSCRACNKPGEGELGGALLGALQPARAVAMTKIIATAQIVSFGRLSS